MSTPRTDAVKIRCGFQAVPEPMLKHAQELERENAALREAKDMVELERCEMMRSMSLAQNYCEQLRADKERLDWLDHNAIPWNWMSPEKIDGLGPIVVTWKSNRTLRAAIDAARKEAQS